MSWLRIASLGPRDGLGDRNHGLLLLLLALERVGPGLLVERPAFRGEGKWREIVIVREPSVLVGLDQSEPENCWCY